MQRVLFQTIGDLENTLDVISSQDSNFLVL